jgi:hypothetical protein
LGDVANAAHPPRGNTSALQGTLAAGDELRSVLLTRTPFQQSWTDVIEHYDALAFEAAPESLQQVDPDAATMTFRTLPFQPRPVPPLTASQAFALSPWPSVPFTSINTASKRAYWPRETKPTLAELANNIAVLRGAATLFGEDEFILVDDFK